MAMPAPPTSTKSGASPVLKTFRSELPFNDSIKAFVSGLPGREKPSVAPAYKLRSRETNSLPIDALPSEIRVSADIFGYLHNIRSAEGEPRFDCGREAQEYVNDREHP
jgi:hypothetical protein